MLNSASFQGFWAGSSRDMRFVMTSNYQDFFQVDEFRE